MSYSSESAKVRDMPNVMKFITGRVLDIGCGPDKITPDALGVDGRDLPGVGCVTDNPYFLKMELGSDWDTVFSSHFLEHLQSPFEALVEWCSCLKLGGHLVLYLPDGDHYNNKENPEHMQDIKYEPFMLWFRRSLCGEGKDFKGNNLLKQFELVDSFMDVGPDRYSFVVIARKV